MEWPVVFVPCLQRNRFPAKGQGGKNKWHVIPRAAIRNADLVRRFHRGRAPALLRRPHAQQEVPLLLVRARCGQPVATATRPLHRRAHRVDKVLTRDPAPAAGTSLPSHPRREVGRLSAQPSASSSTCFECPYQFKLRFLYGFNPPLHEALGYGKSLHDALAEVHKRAPRRGYRPRRARRSRARRPPPSSALRLPPAPRPAERQQALRYWSATFGDNRDMLREHRVRGAGRRGESRRRAWWSAGESTSSAARHGRGDRRRLQVDRASPGRGREPDSTAHVRRGLPGVDRRSAPTSSRFTISTREGRNGNWSMRAWRLRLRS